MANKSKQRVHLNKKHNGQEITIELEYLVHGKEVTSAEKIQVEVWLKQQMGGILAGFTMQFPGLSS